MSKPTKNALESYDASAPQTHLRGIEDLRVSTRLGEAEFLLKRASDKLREAVEHWDKADKPGLWRSNASVLVDQIEAFQRAALVAEGPQQ